MKLFALLFFAALSLAAQTNEPAVADPASAKPDDRAPALANQPGPQVRAQCLQGRRRICGKILKVLPDGLVVDSGYADLWRSPLDHSWLVPGDVQASRAASLVEGTAPESICVGVVFVQDLPKSRGPAPKPRPYDYVLLLGYPAGEHTYNSAGGVTKTVRLFSGDLRKAVNRVLAHSEKSGAPGPAGEK